MGAEALKACTKVNSEEILPSQVGLCFDHLPDSAATWPFLDLDFNFKPKVQPSRDPT
jgi:hypothetical protein